VARDRVRVWYDRHGDYLEVMFDLETPGYFRDTRDPQLMRCRPGGGASPDHPER
jgi:hypothetical protein